MKVKRILAIISFSSLIGLYLIATMPKSVVFTSLALFVIFIFMHYFTKNKYTRHLLISLISVLLSFVYLNFYNIRLEGKIDKINGVENIMRYGQVISVKDYSGSKCYTVKIKTIDDNKFGNFNVNLYTGYNLKVGESLKLTGKFKSFTHKSNYIYNYSKNIYGYFYADEIKTDKTKSISFLSFFANLRDSLIYSAQNLYSNSVLPVVIAMGLGNKSMVSQDIINAFSYSGISHALVVSGLHVGFITLVFNIFLIYIPISKKIKNIIMSLFVFLFMGIIGFTPSIIRAGCLTICMLMGRNLILETDNYTILAVIILVTLVLNPYTRTSASLLLSYSAYFGVITAVHIAEEKKYNMVVTSLLLTTFAILFTAPFLSLLGMDATLISPVFNLLVSPLIRTICSLSFFTSLFGCIPFLTPVIKYAVVPINECAINILLSATDFVKNNLSFALINLADERIKVIIFSTILAVIIALIQFNDKKLQKIFIVIIPLISVLCYNQYIKNIVIVRAFDSGSETSFVITRNDKNYLILSENIKEKTLNTFMNYENIDDFDGVLYCPKKYSEPEIIALYTDNIDTVSETGTYKINDIVLKADIQSRSMRYIIDIGGIEIAFNHKKADMSDKHTEFYFFGSDTPADISADNVFYFTPLLKKHTEIAEEKRSMELYGVLTMKVNIKNGNYKIVEDVKNFGSQL